MKADGRALVESPWSEGERRKAEGLGFKLRGEREIHKWNEAWVDRLTFGVLVKEWKTPKL